MSPIPPAGMPGGSGDPNDLWRLLQQIPGASALVRAFWAAARAGDAEKAARILNQIQALLARYPSIAARFAGMLGNMQRMLRGLLAASDVAPGLAGDLVTFSEEAAEIIAEGEEAAAAIAEFIAAGASESNPIGWLITAAIVLVLVVALSGHASGEEMPHPSPKPPKPGDKPLDQLPENIKTDAAANPAKRLQRHAPKGLHAFAQWRRKHCRCAHRKQAFAPLGPNFAGQQLAMATGPMFPGGGPSGPAGSANSSGGRGGAQGRPAGGGGGGQTGPGGGSPDPFSFPKPGGTKLPPPGKGPGKGPTLPDARIQSQCIWPRCLQFKGPAASA